MLNEMYKQTPEPALRSILKSALDVIGRKVSEEEPADNTPADNTPVQTPQGRNIATAISSDDGFETKGDNLEPGSSADNPIDSKSLTYEAQAQLPIGTWVTTSKGPHRINQGDKNWAKQQMQKTAQPPKASSASTPASTVASTSTGGAEKTKPATSQTGTDTVTTKPYYDTKDGVFKNHQTSTTIPASEADSFLGKHTQYTTKTMPKEQIAQMADPKVQVASAKAKAHAEDAAKNNGTSASYSLGDYEKELPGAAAVRRAGQDIMTDVPIKQMPEVMDFFKDKNNYNLIKSVIEKGGSHNALNASLTPAQLGALVDRGSDYFGSTSNQQKAITQLRQILSGIYDTQEMDADYENFLKTGKTSMAY